MKFFAKSKGKRGEVYIYDSIGEGFFGGISAKRFQETLQEVGAVDGLDIYVNSPGGSVFEGVAIYNLIKRHRASEVIVNVDGVAASIASIIAMAGTKINMAENAMMMIHDPWGMAVGSADEMRKQAAALDKIRDMLLDTYVNRTKGKRDRISEWMSAETWMTAKEAVERGFADSMTEEKSVKASFDMFSNFKHVPDALRASKNSETESKIARMQMRLAQLSK